MRFARELAWPPRLAKMAATDRDGSIAGRIAVRSPFARAGMLIAIVATALHSASLSALELNECCSPSAHRECSTQVYRSLSYPVRDERGQWLVQTSTVPSHSNLARSARNGIESSAARYLPSRQHYPIRKLKIVAAGRRLQAPRLLVYQNRSKLPYCWKVHSIQTGRLPRTFSIGRGVLGEGTE